MTTIQAIKRRVKDKRTGKRTTVHDVRLKRGSRVTLVTLQGYANLGDALTMLLNHIEDFRKDRVRWRGFKSAMLLLLFALPASAINSPRPARFSAADGVLTMTWTNLNTNHAWLLSYADAPGAWRWETNRLAAPGGVLTVSRPMTEPCRFFRLWPAPGDI